MRARYTGVRYNPTVPIVRLGVGIHVERIREHVQHIAHDLSALCFTPGGSLFDDDARGFHRYGNSTPAVVCAPPQDSATRAAASCRMPTRSLTRLSTWLIGTSSSRIKPPITSDLPNRAE